MHDSSNRLSLHRVQPRSSVLTIFLLTVTVLTRLHVAVTQPQIWDESNNSIPLAESISFSSGNINLPLRGQHHPALPSYLVKTSGAIFGHTAAGYRAIHVVIGVLTVFLVFRLTLRWCGETAAIWAASLLALNEYHIGASSFATAKGPYLFAMALSIYAFSQFLGTERIRYLYFTTCAAGLAFYSKEHAVLVLPVYLLTLLWQKRAWLRSPHVYVAGFLFVIVIAPDIFWNLNQENGSIQASYRDHLARIGGVGLTPYPFLFFAHDPIRGAYQQITGSILPDEVAENPSMNALLGLLLFCAVCLTTLRPSAGIDNRLRRFLLTLFWFVFGFFVLIRPGQPAVVIDPVAWYWVDVILFPAVILAGSLLAAQTGRRGTVLRAVAIAAMSVAVLRTVVWWPFADENLL